MRKNDQHYLLIPHYILGSNTGPDTLISILDVTQKSETCAALRNGLGVFLKWWPVYNLEFSHSWRHLTFPDFIKACKWGELLLLLILLLLEVVVAVVICTSIIENMNYLLQNRLKAAMFNSTSGRISTALQNLAPFCCENPFARVAIIGQYYTTNCVVIAVIFFVNHRVVL